MRPRVSVLVVVVVRLAVVVVVAQVLATVVAHQMKLKSWLGCSLRSFRGPRCFRGWREHRVQMDRNSWLGRKKGRPGELWLILIAH